jgi:hypothetical protein
MKLLEKMLPRTHEIVLVSDSHEGTILKHRKGYKKVIKMVADTSSMYLAHLGDLIEGITVDDPRYCIQTTDPQTSTPVRQYRQALEELMPIKDKVLVMLEGNHDWKLSGRYGSLIKDVVCPELAGNKDGSTIYGTYSCKLSIVDRKGELMYKMFLTHGAGSINSSADDPVRRDANMMLSLKRKLFRKAGDCIIQAQGHTHKLIVKPPKPELYLTDDSKNIHQRYTKTSQTADFIHPDLRYYANTGCFYKLYEMGVSGYAERAGYDPNELGYVVVKVVDGIIKSVEPRVI